MSSIINDTICIDYVRMSIQCTSDVCINIIYCDILCIKKMTTTLKTLPRTLLWKPAHHFLQWHECMRSKADVDYSRNMLIRKFVIADWLAVPGGGW